VFVVDTAVSKFATGVKSMLVDSIYTTTLADILAKFTLSVEDTIFILAKSTFDLARKDSPFHQNLDLYAWFFKMPWKYALAQVFFPGIEMPDSLKPALTKHGFKFLEAGRTHNAECFLLIGGKPLNPDSIRGNYHFGVIRAAYWMTVANDLRNKAIHNGIAILDLDMKGMELMIGNAINAYKPPVASFASVDTVTMQFQFDLDLDDTDRGEKRSSRPSEDDTPTSRNSDTSRMTDDNSFLEDEEEPSLKSKRSRTTPTTTQSMENPKAPAKPAPRKKK